MIELFLRLVQKFKVIIKFLISGCTATTVDLILLYIFTDVFNIHYLASTVIAFILAFFVSFGLQKYWTFRDKERDKIYKQLSQYMTVNLINLTINTYGMYILVEKFEIWYLFAQFLMGGFIAIISFIIYRFIIFKQASTVNFDLNKKID